MNISEHIDHLLQDLLDGELDAESEWQARGHLEHCERCRSELASLSALVSDVRALPRTVDPPRDLWGDIEARLGPRSAHPEDAKTFPESLAGAAPSSILRKASSDRSARRRSLRWGIGIAAVVLAAAVAVVWVLARGGGGGWGVEALDGRPLIAQRLIGEQGVLRTGQWLETDATSRARLSVGTIGEVAVEPNTRVQLRSSKLNDHRIVLAEGRIDARIWAPPRLFFVETPAATAIDLGCAYTLDVDSTGRSVLHVTSGYVELERDGKSSVVPAGAMCYASPESGPGTVFAEDAPPDLRAALERYDFEGAHEEDLDVVLSQARTRDAMTLWQLVERTDGARRARIYERLLEVSHPPAGVTREGIMTSDEDMFEMWRLQLGLDAMTWWGYLREKLSFPD